MIADMVSETTSMSTSDLQESSSSQLVIPTSLTPGDVYYIAENSMVLCMSQAGTSQLSPMLTSPAYLPAAGSPSDTSSSPVGISTSYIITGPLPTGYYTTADNPYSTLYVNSGEEYLGSASSPMMCTPDGQCYSPAVDYVVLENGMMSPVDVLNASHLDYEYYGPGYPLTSEFEPSISSEDSSNIVQESVLPSESQGHELNPLTAMQNGYAESVTSDNSMKQPRRKVNNSHGMFSYNSKPTVAMKKATVRYHLNQSFRNGHWANNVIVRAKERDGALRDTQNEPDDLDEKGAVSLDVVMENFPDFTKLGVTMDELKSAIKDADNMVLIEENFLTYRVMGRIVFSGMPTSRIQDQLLNGEQHFEFDSAHIGEMFDEFVRAKIGETDAQELDVRRDLHSVMITSRTFPLNKMEKIFKIFCDYAYQLIHKPENDCCTDGLSLKNISLRKVPISDNVVTIEENGPDNITEDSSAAYCPTGDEEVTIEHEETGDVYDPNLYNSVTTQSATQLIGPASNLSLSSPAFEYPGGHIPTNQGWPRIYPAASFHYDQPPVMNKSLQNRQAQTMSIHSYRNGSGSRGGRTSASGNHSRATAMSSGINLQQQGQRMERSLPPRFQRGMMAQQANYPPNGVVFVQGYPPPTAVHGRAPNHSYHGADNNFYNAPIANSYNENSHSYASNSNSNHRRGHGPNSDNRSAQNDSNSRNGIHPNSGRGGGYTSNDARRSRPNGYSTSNNSRGGRRGANNSGGHYSDRSHNTSRYSDSTTNNKITNSEPPAAPSFGEIDFPSLPVTDATRTSSNSISASNANTYSENDNVNVTVWGTRSTPKSGTTMPTISPTALEPTPQISKNITASKSLPINIARDNTETTSILSPTGQNVWTQNGAAPPSGTKPQEDTPSITNTANEAANLQNSKCTSYADVLKSAGQPVGIASPVDQELNYPPDTAVVSANAATSCETAVGQQVCPPDSSPVQVSVGNGGDSEQQHRSAIASSRGGVTTSRGVSSRGSRGYGASRSGRK